MNFKNLVVMTSNVNKYCCKSTINKGSDQDMNQWPILVLGSVSTLKRVGYISVVFSMPGSGTLFLF